MIWLFMEGAPSAVDMFDPKPELTRRHGQTTDIKAFFGNPGPLMKSPFFQPVRRMRTVGVRQVHQRREACRQNGIHQIVLQRIERPRAGDLSNQQRPASPGFPTAGAWVTYGLGKRKPESARLCCDGQHERSQRRSAQLGFRFPAVDISRNAVSIAGDSHSQSQPAAAGDRARPTGATRLDGKAERRTPAASSRAMRSSPTACNPSNWRFACRQKRPKSWICRRRRRQRMRCTESTIQSRKSFGSKCLMARRLVESGVRFVQVYSDGEWDAHNNLRRESHATLCGDGCPGGRSADRSGDSAGLLDSTLVIWGGEFGRMPISQNGNGRDHNPKGFLQWMAGAGIKGGVSYGETDEIGYEAVENRVSVNDLARHHAAPAGPRPRATDVLPQRPQLSADRCCRQSDPGDPFVALNVRCHFIFRRSTM